MTKGKPAKARTGKGRGFTRRARAAAATSVVIALIPFTGGVAEPQDKGGSAGPVVAQRATTTAAEPEKLNTGGLSSFAAARDGDLFGWSRSNRKTPEHFDAFVRRDGGAAVRVNPRGTEGVMGGISGDRVVYTQQRGRVSDVMLFNVSTGNRVRPPPGVNTSDLEWSPTISGEWLLYGRIHFKRKFGDFRYIRESVLLTNVNDGSTTVLARGGNGEIVAPGQIAGDYAVYTVCRPACFVVRYQLSTQERMTAPDSGGVLYRAAVTPDGTVLYTQSGYACGAGADLLRWSPGHKLEILYRFPDKEDLRSAFAYVGDDGRPRLLFDRGTCQSLVFHVYELHDDGFPGAAVAGPDATVSYQIDPTHDGTLMGGSLLPPLAQAWTRDAGGYLGFPLVAQGRVFVLTQDGQSVSEDTKLWSFSLADGQPLWSRSVPGTYGRARIAYGGGRVFVMNYDGLMTALDAVTGDTDWIAQFPEQHSFTHPPTEADGLLYTGGAGTGSTLFAQRSVDGEGIWLKRIGDVPFSSPAVQGDALYATHGCGNTYKLDRWLGALLWDADDACTSGSEPPVVAEGRVYTRAFGSGEGLILDAESGALVDSFESTASPAIDQGTAVYTLQNRLTAAKTSDQAEKWAFEADSHFTSAPIIVNDVVYAHESDGDLYALALEGGNLLWQSTTELKTNESDTTLGVGEGMLVVASGDTLYAYRHGTGGPSPTPTPSPSPSESCTLPPPLC